MAPELYGDDRLFVYMRLGQDYNSETDDAIQQIESSGQPVVRLDLRDKYDLGAEFFPLGVCHIGGRSDSGN